MPRPLGVVMTDVIGPFLGGGSVCGGFRREWPRGRETGRNRKKQEGVLFRRGDPLSFIIKEKKDGKAINR